MSDAFIYDVVDYPMYLHPQMHPSRIGAIARLHGIAAPSPVQCRLLDVGCGDGLQLIALALAYPQARFVGVDLSANAIARGEALRARLGLDNLQLFAADLMQWQPGRQPFDYIVAHGFYSWVPGMVRGRLLDLCRDALAPHGVAYISYNAMPGCHLRQMIWEMLRFHVRDTTDPVERLRKAREFLAWLGTDVLERGAYGPAIRREAEHILNDTHPSVVFHDDLAGINNPFTLIEFAGHAQAHGLEFLGEAEYHEMNPALLGKAGQARFEAVRGPDRLANDQYLDFLKGRRFRQSLLCHPDAGRHDAPEPRAILSMHACGHMRAEEVPAEVDGQPVRMIRYANPDGAALSTNHPVAQAALSAIAAAFPQPISVQALLDASRAVAASEATRDEDAEVLSQALLRAFELGLLSLQVDPPRFAATAGDFPLASPLARLQVESGLDTIANLRPSLVSLDSRPAIELLRLLDGSRDRPAILRDLALRMAECEIPGEDGTPERHDPEWWTARLGPALEDALDTSVRMALLLEAG